MKLFAYLLKNYERKMYVILMFKNSKLLHYLYHQRKMWAFFISTFQGGNKHNLAVTVLSCPF